MHKAFFLFFAVPMIFLETRMLLSGLVWSASLCDRTDRMLVIRSFGLIKPLEKMWFECWGGALRDEIKTAARETRLRAVY